MTDISHDAPAPDASAPDAYAPERETTEGTVYTVTGGDWDTLLDGEHDDRIVINMGPQHPSTHGVLRLVLELEGETVQQARSVIGYLHTGIEKNCEYRNWTQGVTFVTRMDYLAPIFNEVGLLPGRGEAARRRGPAPRARSPGCCSWSSTGSARTWCAWPPAAWSWARSPA